MPPHLAEQLGLARCPCCNVDHPNLVKHQYFQTTAHDDSNKRFWGIYVCNNCGGVVTAANKSGIGQAIAESYPAGRTVDEAVPDRARQYLSQAMNTLHAPAGAVMLAASAVDAMLKAKSLKDGSLYARIDKAAEDHIITAEMAQWAHDVRLDANDQRHSDEAMPLPTPLDAERAIDFALALAQFMFVLPARVQRGLNAARSPQKGTGG